ncbi:hypothetical protein E2C01_004676 [Portunus trituberculatus]|uniref:Uncharacterized protein n=1 Tax=Portunus trituberculatus TaxID=210409 RepID=A0A5B7CR60_PORTR|nr:hypothetical protein [Portunus trituberculatus]
MTSLYPLKLSTHCRSSTQPEKIRPHSRSSMYSRLPGANLDLIFALLFDVFFLDDTEESESLPSFAAPKPFCLLPLALGLPGVASRGGGTWVLAVSKVAG